MSVSRGGGSGVTSADGLNWATVGDTTADTGGNGNLYRTDVDLPDKHVMALHAIRFSLSDIYDQQEGQAEVWVYNDDDDPNIAGGWGGRALQNSDLIWHANIGSTRDAAGNVLGNQVQEAQTTFPLPVLNGNGEITVNQSGTNPSGGDLEWIVHFYYDVVPAQDTDAYLELLLRQ